jgi:hypothetical protein
MPDIRSLSANRRGGLRRALYPGLTMVFATASLVAIKAAPAAAASGSASCFPALEQTIGGNGAFNASTGGTGSGNVAIENGTTSSEGTGQVTWAAKQSVTGNNGAGGSMTGTLALSVRLGGQSISFASSCILEAGVFAGETEDDPFDPEDNHLAIRGIEGEWIGTAVNYPVAGQSTQVVASLAVWTTSVGPRFHLDITTATFTAGQCPNESGDRPGISAGGPTQSGSNIVVTGPNLRAGRGECAD